MGQDDGVLKSYTSSHDQLVSSGYPAGMLTEGAQSWRVEGEPTWGLSVNIEAKYNLVLTDYKEKE